MAVSNKSSLNNMLQAVTSALNIAQNQAYPPYIYTAHYNTVASFLMSELAKQYPKNTQVVDMLNNFLKIDVLPVQDGFVTLPDNYRNILPDPSVYVNVDGSDCSSPQPLNGNTFKANQLKAGCKRIACRLIPKSEFDDLTQSTYRFPTYKAPVCYFYAANTIKVCPYDLPKIELTYLINEGTYRFGYITQPDDTYIYDPETSIESEFDNSAFEPLFKGIYALASSYLNNPELRNWSLILNEKGVI